MLCLLRDGEGKPMHIRVIGNDPTEYRDLCRDYAAFALLKQTQTALNSTVEKYGFIKSSDVRIHIPKIMDIPHILSNMRRIIKT